MIVKKSIGQQKIKINSPWSWIPTLYISQGLPFIIVTSFSVIMYKRLGISNTEIALYTSWLYLPWVIKPLWSPVIDVFRTKRFWITFTQLFVGAGMAGVALTIPAPDFFQFTLAFFWIIAFSSSTFDISSDGFYMLALTEKQQSFFIGFRTAFYKAALIGSQGLLIILAGQLETHLTIQPVEFKVAANPEKFFENTIQVDTTEVKSLPGNIKLVANPTILEIGTKPISEQSVNFYKSFAKKFNMMNGFIPSELMPPDTTISDELAGNIGIVKFHLSKAPSAEKEYDVNLEFLEGTAGINIIEGNNFKFNSKNWNKPAFAVIQIDPTIQKNTGATFKLQSDKVPLAWLFTFSVLAILIFLFFFYHKFILPQPVTDKSVATFHQTTPAKEFIRAFTRFFERDKILIIIGFLLFFNFSEAQIIKMINPFLLDQKISGGLALTTTEVGLGYSTIGVIALLIGGVIGGYIISFVGLKKMLWWMLISINLPNFIYVYLAFMQPSDINLIYFSIGIEQFGYGFGFTAFIMYMIYISEGDYKTSHFALASAFMTLGLMIPGMFSGIIQQAIGYQYFFIWLIIAAVPSFILAKYIPLDSLFGKRHNINEQL